MRLVVSALLSMVLLAGSWAQAQEDTAPQEAPYIQEDNEFDVFSNESPATEESDALAIEEDLKTPSENQSKKESVNLNQETSDKNIEDELILEEDNPPMIAEPAPVPVEQTPVVEVRPSQQVKTSKMIRKSARGGVEYIHHPQAAKGLTTITKEGAYIYRVKDSNAYSKSGAFRFGMMDAPKIYAADGTSYAQMYSGDQQPVLFFDFEWQPFQAYGKLGLQAGFGLLLANGKGRFIQPDTDGNTEAKEKYTFVAIPLNLGVVYRLEWMDRQWFAPYVAGGGTYIAVAEFRDDNKGPNGVGTPGAYGAAGVLLNITAMSRETAFTMKSEYGISNLWVSLDFRQIQTFTDDLDFSSSVIGAGVVVDY